MYVNEERKEKAIPAVLNRMTLQTAANLFERKKTRRRETSHQSKLLI